MFLPGTTMALEQFGPWINPLVQNKLSFVVCPGVLNSYRLWPNYRQTKKNIRHFCMEGFEKSAMGVLNTVWDDGGRHFFHNDWYGVAYGAAYSWYPDSTANKDFDNAYSIVHHQDSSNTFGSVLHAMSDLAKLSRLSRLNNDLLEMDYGGSGLLEEWIDTSGFVKLKATLRNVLAAMPLSVSKTRGRAQPASAKEWQYFRFKVEELMLNIQTAEKSYRWL